MNPMPWVLSTILAVFVGIFIAALVIAIVWMRDFGALSQEQMLEKVRSGEIKLTAWNDWFVLACAFGGYLFVRYLLDRKARSIGGDDNSPTE